MLYTIKEYIDDPKLIEELEQLLSSIVSKQVDIAADYLEPSGVLEIRKIPNIQILYSIINKLLLFNSHNFYDNSRYNSRYFTTDIGCPSLFFIGPNGPYELKIGHKENE